MTPFQQSRAWVRGAKASQLAMSAAALLVVVALLGWLVWPVSHGGATSVFEATGGPEGAGSSASGTSQSPSQAGGTTSAGGVAGSGAVATGGTPSSSGTGGSAAAGAGTGGSTAAGTGSSAGAGAVSSNAAGPSNSTAAPGSGSKAGRDASTSTRCPVGTDQGVTATSVDVAVTIIDISGQYGNSALGVPTPAEQQQDWQTVANSINSSGGAGCKKLALAFFSVNPVDPNQAQQECLAIAASHPFIALDTGALTEPGASDCVPEQHVPLVSSYLTAAQVQKYYPYYLAPSDVASGESFNGMAALARAGYFSASKGFAKLGVVYDDCVPDYYNALRQGLAASGVPNNKIVAYDMGCPAAGGENNPAQFQQAILTFKGDGVTDVTEAAVGDFGTFTNLAQQQGYKPQYVFADTALPATSTAGGSFAFNPANGAGAVDMTGGGYGEQTTPGFQPGTGTQRCNALFAAVHQPPVYQQSDGYGGVVCDYLWFTAALISHTPALQRNALIDGMRGIGYFDASYPAGPTNFGAAPAAAGYGIGYTRPIVFQGSCGCWRVQSSAWTQGSH